jgi:hypothetical protein
LHREIVPYRILWSATYRCHDRGHEHRHRSVDEPSLLVDANLCWLLSRANHVLMTELTAALQSLRLSPRAHHVLPPDDEREVFVNALGRLVGQRLHDPADCARPVRRRQ